MGRTISAKNNFFYLTASLIILLISATLAQALSGSWFDWVLKGVTLFNFAVCLISLQVEKIWFRLLIVIAAGWAIVSVCKLFFPFRQMDTLILLLMLCFFLGTFKIIARKILFTGSIDVNKVVGSVALFLLLGLMWAMVYLIILEFSPQAFTGMTQLPWGENFANVTYFSFVTLTTLGYGDISPLSEIARVAVYLEAIAGIFYMAIVVASLVGASQQHRGEKQDPP
ncbi:potassium channel family protein [Photobacterium atrarenae]|uniref:Ion channel n=1 Tax=Photobacterium atrarenae TaxID=865757 RepID=A0ABY5GK49_9GAMM|nr:potassium channel family protein [Photobacterium atrarenae]UTV28932.1 ion channel [Photobacterium atrarenae]